MPDNAAVIAELTRVKVLFQQRALIAALGLRPSELCAPGTVSGSGIFGGGHLAVEPLSHGAPRIIQTGVNNPTFSQGGAND